MQIPSRPASLGEALALSFALVCSSISCGSQADHAPGAPDASVAAATTLASDAPDGLFEAYVAERQAEGRADARYHLARDGAAFVGRSALEDLDVRVDGAGIAVGRDRDGWRARLATRAIACDGRRVEIGAGAASLASAEPNRATIARRAGRAEVAEWAVNGPLGVEHGLTLEADPCEGGAAELVVEVGVAGLSPSAGGVVVTLRDAASIVRARYSALFARDASGARLASRLAASGDAIELRVKIEGARWPVTIDPLVATEEARLTSSDAAAFDSLGSSLVVRGTTAVVGAPNKSTAGRDTQGAAYVFEQTGTSWTLQTKLLAGDGAGGDAFGSKVDYANDVAVIGAPNAGAAAGDARGAAYVFARKGATWSQQAKLLASDGVSGDFYGGAVATSGATIVVGAMHATVGGASDAGTAYVYVRDASSGWSQQAKLAPSDGAAGDFFGVDVGLSGDLAIVGAHGKSASRGAAYVFARNAAGAWAQQGKLVASDAVATDALGISVAIDGGLAVAGAWSKAVGANAGQGAAYVFVQSGTTWSQQAKLVASDGTASDAFGLDVGLSGTTAVVGASRKAVGANANQGAAYVFVQSGTTWSQQAKLVAADGVASDTFANAVSVSGQTVLAGSPYKTIGATTRQGAAYAFARSGTTWTQQARLVHGDAAASEFFGQSVAVSGGIGVVGAPGFAAYRGAVYVFTRSGATWVLSGKLLADDGAASDSFGISVALGAGTLVVGAPLAVVGGAQRGAAYVYTLSGGSFSSTSKLVASAGAAGDQFGAKVATDGNTVLVGASMNQGAAYVFEPQAGAWSERARLAAPSGSSGFGSAVAVSGGSLVVGASATDGNRGRAYVYSRGASGWAYEATLAAQAPLVGDYFGVAVGVAGDEAFVGAQGRAVAGVPSQGAVYAFRRQVGAWSAPVELVAADGVSYDAFGASLAVDSRTLIVGAFGAASARGAAYVFVESGTRWTQQAKLTASDGASFDFYGIAVAVGSRGAFVGAYEKVIGGNANQGEAYAYSLHGVAGEPCLTDGDCASAYACSDGVCCASACSGPCDVCARSLGASADGTCTLLAQGTIPALACPGNLVCNGVDGLCPAACTSDVECAKGSFCTSAGTCQPTRPNGAACDVNGDCKDPASCALCLSGHCVDGYCCDSTCSGACDRCDLYGVRGTCSAVDASTATPCGAGYVCDGVGAECPASCASDDACRAGFYCGGASSCVALAANGAACSTAAHCASGHCVDGVCCDTACRGTCMACSKLGNGKLDGECNDAVVGQDPHDDCGADSPASCGQSGACDGAGKCQRWFESGSPTTCAPRACDGNKVAARICTGAYVCGFDVASELDCGAQRCVAGECAPCVTTAECADPSTTYCAAGGVCAPKLAQAGACVSDDQCATGHCVDGVCCDSACKDTCEWCGDAARPGVCVVVSGTPSGAGKACAEAGTGACAARCDGAKRDGCSYPSAGTECQAATCRNDALVEASSCDGAGKCAPGSTRSCGDYACGAVGDAAFGCKTACTTSGDCRVGAVCDTSSGTGTCNPAGASCEGPYAVKAADGTVSSCAGYACKAGACRSACSAPTDCDAANGYACVAGRCTLAEGGARDAGADVEVDAASAVDEPAEAATSCACTVPGSASARERRAASWAASLLALGVVRAARRRSRRPLAP